jgi:Fic family protein
MLIGNKPVIGPRKDILEVMNAMKVYDNLTAFNPLSSKSFLKAHGQLMKGLVEEAGAYRHKNVGIFQGSRVAHIAPSAGNVPHLMKGLFDYLKNEEELTLIKSCVFHYEMEFIHPFADGNGRMGRLWQTVILQSQYPVFEFLPFETLIIQSQDQYYEVLSRCDNTGNSTEFIEYMLGVIEKSLVELLSYNRKILTDNDRIAYFVSLGKTEFSRKDYMNVFKDLSGATASRDLRKGVELTIFGKTGDKSKAIYSVNDQGKQKLKN